MTKKYETFHRDYELCECAVPAVYCHGCNSMNDPSHVEGGHCGDCGEERVGVILANHGHYSCPTTCGKCSGKGYLRVRPATSRPPCAACAVIIDKIDALIDLCAATWITDELKTIRALAASGDGEVLAVIDVDAHPDALFPPWGEATVAMMEARVSFSVPATLESMPVTVIVKSRKEGECL